MQLFELKNHFKHLIIEWIILFLQNTTQQQ